MSVVTVTCRIAHTLDEVATHARIRSDVFVVEQGLFQGTDQDAFDRDPEVRHVLGYVDEAPAGTVRLYRVPADQPGEQLWKGDRLAVLPEYRHAGLGGPLVRFAVATAGEAGGDRMIANIQTSNVSFFRRLGWAPVGDPFEYVGEPHQQMWIDLR